MGLRLVLPPPQLCTDDGAMIAWAGIERLSLNANAEAAHHGKARGRFT